MSIIDISWPITNNMVTYKNKNDVLIEQIYAFESHGYRESKVSLGMHTGTHVDAPAHFLSDGVTTDQLILEQLIGWCTVFDLTHLNDKITQNDLEKIDFTGCERVLFKTKNSLSANTGLFCANFVYLDYTAAKFLITKNLKVIGIDGLGIERCQPDHETHNILFRHKIWIIEGLRLGHVLPGNYELVCLPLSIMGSEAAPARAILRR